MSAVKHLFAFREHKQKKEPVMNKLSLLWLVCFAFSANASPPCSGDKHRQFDFWLGEWTAYSEDGEKQGTNNLRSIVGGCAMQENWSSAGGVFKGTSYNFYDENRKVWHQTWVDNSGGRLLLEGGLKDGKMVLEGSQLSDGSEVLDRITWTPLPDGRVRQHWQRSADEGENWQDVFDGYYQRDE